MSRGLMSFSRTSFIAAAINFASLRLCPPTAGFDDE